MHSKENQFSEKKNGQILNRKPISRRIILKFNTRSYQATIEQRVKRSEISEDYTRQQHGG